MKAIVLNSNLSDPITLIDKPIPIPGENQCLVKISYSSLNLRDQWIRLGKYPSIKDGIVLGSDCCGKVVEGSNQWINKKVIINPNINWGMDEKVQSENYSILGMPLDGTLSEYICINEDRLEEMPFHLQEYEAASIPLAGLTAFRATFIKGEVSRDKNVLITGASGGVAQFAILFSLSVGANVFVASQNDTTIQKYIDLGVSGGFNTSEKKWPQKVILKKKFDVIIDSIGGDSIENYLKVINPGGKIIIYGSSAGYPQKLDTYRIFWNQINITGSTMGSDNDFKNMVAWVKNHNIKPIIDKFYLLDDFRAAFDRFNDTNRLGKIVLQH